MDRMEEEQTRRLEMILSLGAEFREAYINGKSREIIDCIVHDLDVVTTRYTFFKDLEATCQK